MIVILVIVLFVATFISADIPLYFIIKYRWKAPDFKNPIIWPYWDKK